MCEPLGKCEAATAVFVREDDPKQRCLLKDSLLSLLTETPAK